MMAAIMPDGEFSDLPKHLEHLRERIDAVDRPWSHDVRIVAVTKGFDHCAVDAAGAARCTAIGENYAQEILSKREALVRTGADIHFIGHLQSNKIRQLAGIVSIWSTIDRPSLADELAKRSPGANVRLQVNLTDESQKGGCEPDTLAALLEHAVGRGLNVEGLMTIGPTGTGPEAARPAFAALRGLVDEYGLAECSMGMTADLEIAVAEGTTEIRVGTALFGARPPRG